MRIITRGDFDGLVSCVLLSLVEKIGEIRFAHPKDVGDGKVEAGPDDIVVNLPYIKDCGLWFDHHLSEEDKIAGREFQGRFARAPSCARVIYDYYADRREAFAPLADLLEAVDRLDSANLALDDVLRPEGWILLGLTLDPRSGLGPEFRDYFRWLVDFVRERRLDEVMALPEVKKRTDRVRFEQERCKEILARHARLDGNVIVTDLRSAEEMPVGNRFLVFTMFPEANVEMRILRGFQGATTVAVGHSIFNRSCPASAGDLCRRHGGGGHRGAGTCQLAPDQAEAKIAGILAELKR